MLKKDKNLLNYLESLTKVNVSYFFKNTLVMLLPIIISVAGGLLKSIGFARLATKEVYGQFIFVMSFISIISILSFPGMKKAVTRSVASGNINSFKLFLPIKIKYSYLGTLVCFITALYFFITKQTIIATSFIVAGIFFVPFYGYDLWGAFYEGNKKFVFLSLFVSLVSFFSVAFIFICLWKNASVPVIITAALLSRSILNILITRFLVKKLPVVDTGKTAVDVSFAKHLTFIEAVGQFFSGIDKILIAFLVGFEQLAIYGIASAFQKQIRGVLRMETGLLLPKLSEIEREKAFLKVKSRFFLITGISLSIGIVGIFVAKPLILLFYSSGYSNSIFYAQLLILFMSIGFPSRVIHTLFLSQAHTKSLYILNVVLPGISLVIMIPLIYYFGIIGAVMAKGIYWIAAYFTSYYMAFVKKKLNG